MCVQAYLETFLFLLYNAHLHINYQHVQYYTNNFFLYEVKKLSIFVAHLCEILYIIQYKSLVVYSQCWLIKQPMQRFGFRLNSTNRYEKGIFKQLCSQCWVSRHEFRTIDSLMYLSVIDLYIPVKGVDRSRIILVVLELLRNAASAPTPTCSPFIQKILVH
jgi:hypothetical protein